MTFLPDKESPAWPWLRMTTRQVLILCAFMWYYRTGLEKPDLALMLTVLVGDVGMTTIAEKLKTN